MKKLLHIMTLGWSLILVLEIGILYLINELIKPWSDLVVLFNVNTVCLLILAVILIAGESYQIAFTFAKIKQRFVYHAWVETMMDCLFYGMCLFLTLNIISFLIMAFNPSVTLTAILLLISGILARPLALILTIDRTRSLPVS